ncbi:ABC transporter permease [Verrucomicrobiota bacterium]
MTIRPEQSLLDPRLGELWRYRDLVLLFVWRDFVAVYKQTVLGPLWYVVQAVLTTLVFTVIFGKVAKLSTDGLPQFLFYMSGVVLWRYFAECLTRTSTTFTTNAHIFGKVYFPRLSVPVSVVISSLVAFAIQFGLFLGFMAYFYCRGAAVRPGVLILLTPVLLLIMAGLGLGGGIVISSITTRYRDFQYLVRFGVQLLMYATPVIYPVSALPARFRWVALVNPMAPVIETFRYAYLGAGTCRAWHLVYSGVFMVSILAIGIMMFNRIERTFMDTV